MYSPLQIDPQVFSDTVTERGTRKLARELRKNPKQAAGDLKKPLDTTGIKVYISTVKCSLHKSGLLGRKARRKPLLTSRHKAARLEYAKEQDYVSFWQSLIYKECY
uniref:Transposase Tc1-like domain-containing protein n=1 Tax=Monopterus albus TaxID=43700 RepID=A0A3Q3JVK3_MONAL